MKFIFLLGGAAGFALAAGTSRLAGNEADRVLLDGAVGCLGAALLFRWFWQVVLSGIRETVLQRQAKAAAAAAAAPATPVSSPNPAASAAKAK
jgi:hypothetical protein